LVQKFVEAELGNGFPLARLLGRRIGVHNAGLPEEIRELMEWLMENELLKVLVATTTIAQGVNFPVSTIVMASYAYPYTKHMPVRDFWNLVGRAGRIDQRSVGIVAIAVSKKNSEDTKKAAKFVKESTEALVSVLARMVEQSVKLGTRFNLEILANVPEWSIFLQYISHMYNQSQNLQNFIAEVEITLRRTFGYNQLDNSKKQALMQAVRDYAQNLDKKKHLATLSDLTGFAPETIQHTMHKLDSLDIKQSDWTSSRLFSSSPETLGKLIGIMLTDIPEIRNNLDVKVSGQRITHSVLSRIVSDWVGGTDIVEIAKKYFGGANRGAITQCVTAIYGKVSGSATWGLAAMQKLPTSGISFDKLSEDEKRRINNLPAMVFYGVNTDEAILMRINNVPRSISQRMGELFKKRSQASNLYETTGSEITRWLESLENSDWDKVVPSQKRISGKDYKQVWKQLSGLN
jgi:replicative superfamily II helicase